MLGFFDLVGSDPCVRCGSQSGDCGWLRTHGRCTAACPACRGSNVGRCTYCDEVVPCGLEPGRNPRPDANCAWEQLGRLHGEECRWTLTRGGTTTPLPAAISPL